MVGGRENLFHVSLTREIFMIKEEITKHFICDWCGRHGSYSNIRSFVFEHFDSDEHGRTSWDKKHIELCDTCQHEAYELLKSKKKDY